jgi:ring-1,2-phenylacetyl-CoA epoxidase subunit PaaD
MNFDVIDTFHPAYAQRLSYRANSPHQELFSILDQVFDPELPGLTLWDLGVLQAIEKKDQYIEVVITPTYSGCPAVDAMTQDIIAALKNSGFDDVIVTLALAPAWNTDMISPAGKKQLRALHIAPPDAEGKVCCPVCDSDNTQVLSEFGSTACKAMYRCGDCMEVFDYFKKLS